MIEDFEGFEVDRTTTALALKYASLSVVGTASFQRGALQGYSFGRDVGDATLNHLTWETKAKPIASSRTVGMRVRIANPDTNGGTLPSMFSFKRYGSVQLHADVVDDGDGDWYLEIYRGSVLIATSKTITQGEDVYVELAVTFHPTAGALELRFGGQPDVVLSGINTAATGGPGCTSILHDIDVDGSDANSLWVVDDIYYDDDFNFNGDCVVEGCLPDGPGLLSQFTPSAGQNYAAVDDATQSDSDSTYVRLASGATGKDVYSFESPRYTRGDPLACKIAVTARLEAANCVAHLYPLFSDGATSARGGAVMDVTGTSYAYYSSLMLTDPIAGDDWRLADVLAGQLGVERA